MASTSFTLSPAIDLPLPAKASITSSQSVPLFLFRPLNSPSSRLQVEEKGSIAASASRSNAVSEQVVKSVATDSTADSQMTLSRPSSFKLVLVVGGTGDFTFHCHLCQRYGAKEVKMQGVEFEAGIKEVPQSQLRN